MTSVKMSQADVEGEGGREGGLSVDFLSSEGDIHSIARATQKKKKIAIDFNLKKNKKTFQIKMYYY